jgi:hypothetical protein
MTKNIDHIIENGYYKDIMIEGIQSLSDEAYQKLAWFENDQNVHSCYADDVTFFQDDTGLSWAYERAKYVFGPEIDTKIKEFFREVEKISFFDLEKHIIKMPQIKVIREKAKILLSLIENASPYHGVHFLIRVKNPVILEGRETNQYKSYLAEELPDKTFHLLRANDSRDENKTFVFQAGDIVRCTKTITPDIFHQRIFTATEKVGFEAVV